MNAHFASSSSRSLAGASLFVVAALVVACTGSTADSPSDAGADGASDASGDAASHDAAMADGSASDASANDAHANDALPPACNTLVNVAPLVGIDFVASAPPVAQGGTIADGKYTMTSAAIYTGVGGPSGPSGASAQVTIVVTGTTIQVASKANPPDDHLTTTITTNGTRLTATNTCPDPKSSQGEYSATATTLVVLLPAGTSDGGAPRTLVESFTKQ